MRVNLENVVEAIEYGSDEPEFFYLVNEERVIFSQEEDIDDSMDLIPLPTRRDVDDYHNMELFIDTVDDDNIAEWLTNAIHGRGAFRMFRATLERFGIVQDWYDFRDRAHRVLAMEWCDDNGIEYDDMTYSHNDDEETEEEAPVTVSIQKPNVRYVRVNEDNYFNILSLFQKTGNNGPSLTEAQEDLEDLLELNTTWIAAVDHGRYIGFIEAKEDIDTLTVQRLYVMEERRNEGVGRGLVSQMEQEAENAHCEVVFHVNPSDESGISFVKHMCYDQPTIVEYTKSSR